ncbi:hypothetical protein ACFVXQ_00110 [Kitasatospora sp. NPDC058263]
MPPSRAELAAKRARLVELATAGRSTSSIATELHMDRRAVRQLRAEAGIPALPGGTPQPLTVEEKWQARTQPLDGGHLGWTGETATGSGTPVMRHSGTTYTAGRIAYRIQHGQDPAGYARPGCGQPGCVAPDHQVDTGATRPARQHRARYPSPEAKLNALSAPTEGGHQRWTGPMDGQHPLLKHGGRRYSVLALAFRQHHGRDPIGTVRVGCDLPGCVAGAHLDDAPARARLRTALAAIGL